VVFSDTLARCRDLLEPGKAVLVSVEAEREGDTVKMRVNALEALDAAAQDVNRGLKIVLDGRQMMASRGPLAELKALLKPGGKGEIKLALEVAGVPGVPGSREIEIALPGRYEISAMQRGELSTIRGVIDVLEL
jgi:DNA polymerase III subunit alpha